jgi:hypothetical protein
MFTLTPSSTAPTLARAAAGRAAATSQAGRPSRGPRAAAYPAGTATVRGGKSQLGGRAGLAAPRRRRLGRRRAGGGGCVAYTQWMLDVPGCAPAREGDFDDLLPGVAPLPPR